MKARIRCTFETTIEVHSLTDNDSVDFWLNESSFCKSSIVDWLQAEDGKDGFCLCEKMNVQVLELSD